MKMATNAVVAVDCNSEENTTAEGVHGGKRKGAGRPMGAARKVNILTGLNPADSQAVRRARVGQIGKFVGFIEAGRLDC